MSSDIPERSCPEQRIADGMRESVAVGMADRAFLEGNPHAAQDQFAAGGKAVNVIPNSDPKAILDSEF
jgi:hypothetical protein